MGKLTMLIDSHLLDNGKFAKEYSLNNKIQLNEYSCMDVPNAVYNKLGELEDVLEKYGIENLEEYISALVEARKFAIEESKINFKRHIEETTKREKLEQELAELKQKMIVPKYNLRQTCFIIWENDIMSAQIEKIIMKLSKDEEENSIYYSITNQYGYALRFPEEQIFATKEEAEQKLAGIGGKDE